MRNRLMLLTRFVEGPWRGTSDFSDSMGYAYIDRGVCREQYLRDGLGDDVVNSLIGQGVLVPVPKKKKRQSS